MYPTKEEILKEKPKFRKGTILITNLWKTTAFKGWKKEENWVKTEKLGLLIEALSALHRKKSPGIILGHEYCFDIRQKAICLDINNPSIISSLHELGHYLYGSSELKACRWSIWLFKECFPELYKQLEWKKHMLVKKKEETERCVKCGEKIEGHYIHFNC